MLTTYQQSDIIFDSLRAGASGYLLKNMSHSELIQAVEQVHAGGAPMSTQIARKVVEHFRSTNQPASEVDRLSPREQEVLAMLAKGFLYKEIGDNLGILGAQHRAYAFKAYLRKASMCARGPKRRSNT